MPDTPRPEHPRPQFQRDAWLNLNGTWTFAFDPGKSGREAGWQASRGFERTITVPFCPESALSGVGHTDFIEAMWYHRAIRIPDAWAGKRVLLHFGAIDYEAEVFLDGRSIDLHLGGTVGFTTDLTRHVTPGTEHHLVVRVYDDVRSGVQPGGKQCPDLRSRGCHYTRTTGIWQSVWLEAADPHGLRDVVITPDLDGGRFIFTPRVRAARPDLMFQVIVGDAEPVAVPLADGVPAVVELDDPRPWSPDDPHLYEVTYEVLDGRKTIDEEVVIDRVASYAGLRKVHVEGDRIYLNNRPIFLRLVLDQGFYPDGIWTAPSDEALRRDIELAMDAGFNGARLHQKVFEQRFHYWADKLGYLTWGESSSWGVRAWQREAMRNFIPEWEAIIERDRNHPSIIAWTPLNESWHDNSDEHRRTVTELYERTRALDPTRLINTTSGGNWYRHDITTLHCYQQDPGKFPEELANRFAHFKHCNIAAAREAGLIAGPIVIDEYGGTRWNPAEARGRDRTQSWGYGDDPPDERACLERIAGLTQAILADEGVCGYCYTQLTDVEQEQNGLYFYDRSRKFDPEQLRKIFGVAPSWSAFK